MTVRPRHKLVPNANSPQLLARLLETIARGVRSTRGLQEALGVDGRAVRAYTQAGVWLGFLQDEDELWLTPLGLEFVYAGRGRGPVFARAVRGTPLIADLLGDDGGPPSRQALAAAIAQVDPELSESTIARRAAAIHELVAAALEKGRLPDEPHQLALPLSNAPTEAPTPKLTLEAGREYNPDIYRYLLGALIDHGELTLGHVRGLLDGAGAQEAPIGGYVDLALSRGDARRTEERLVVTRGAVAHRDLAESTASVILSDPGYRAWLEDLVAERGDRHAAIRRNRSGGRYRFWDRRLLGRDADEATLRADLDRVLMDRSLASFPLRGDPRAEPAQVDGAFLDCWETPGLLVTLPPSLGWLAGGLPAVNRALLHERQSTAQVAAPSPACRPAVAHGALVHPGEPLPRTIPDVRTLRQRLVLHAPYPAMVTALLLSHRQDPGALQVVSRRGRWEVRRGERAVGEVLTVLDTFAARRGWVASRRAKGGLGASALVDALAVVGVAVVVGSHLVLDEAFFGALRAEPEELELHARLQPIAAALADHVVGLEPEAP